MKRRLWIAAVLTVTALGGCSPRKLVHDKHYFTAHDTERTTMVAGCQKSPGLEAADANCINAIAAQADVDRQKFYTVTPPASRQSDPGKL